MAAPRILAVAVVVAALAAPATAAADQGGAQGHGTTAHTPAKAAKASTLLTAAAHVGRRYWGAVPCNGQIRFVARSRLAPGMHRDTDAWVTFDSTLGANNLGAPAGSYTNCVVALARWRWPTAASMSADWNMLCTTMIHEMGHLLGHSHDTRHGSVMVPIFVDGSSVPSICRTTAPRAVR